MSMERYILPGGVPNALRVGREDVLLALRYVLKEAVSVLEEAEELNDAHYIVPRHRLLALQRAILDVIELNARYQQGS